VSIFLRFGNCYIWHEYPIYLEPKPWLHVQMGMQIITVYECMYIIYMAFANTWHLLMYATICFLEASFNQDEIKCLTC